MSNGKRRGHVAGIGLAAALMMLSGAGQAEAQQGSLRGVVQFARTQAPVHGAVVLVVGTGRSATTDAEGRFEIAGLPAATYDVVAQREHLATARQAVTVVAERPVEVTFELDLLPVHEELTVTASPTGETTTFEAFNSIQTIDSFEIARSAAPTLAGVLSRAPGVDVRSFGPGSERPIIRGFDGDRVLILEDSMRTGDLSSQSGDHGVTLDPGALDRIEIVRGPATLLYGSNAVGGVVHALTPQEAFRRTPFAGLRGQFLTDAGSGNGQAGGNANVQYGHDRWMLWAGGGSRRTRDYSTPEGTVENSAAWMTNGRVGVGYNGTRAFFSAGYETEVGRYGVPFAGAFHAHGDDHDHDHDLEAGEHDADEEHGEDDEHDHEAEDLQVDLEPRRRNVRLDFGVRNLQNAVAESARVIVNRIDWRHDEIEIEEGAETLGTRFNNATTGIRIEVEQRARGRLAGRFGTSLEFRGYQATGAEALAPPTDQAAFGLFAYEQLDFGRARLMFGGRFDRTAYDTEERPGLVPSAGDDHGEHEHDEPDHDDHDDHDHDDHDHGDAAGGLAPPATRDRTFTGASGSLGVHVDLFAGTAVVATLTRSYRAPALEELYNFGPHVGNLAFEIGNTDLNRESSLAVDVSLRHRSTRVRGEVNLFTYGIDDFVFASTNHDLEVDGLFVARYLQANSRFTGIDAQASVHLHAHAWLHAGIGFVRARLTETDEALPRIPPLRGRLSLDLPFGGLTVSPELIWAARQDQVFRDETPTGGYALLNLQASYVLARSHQAHILTISGDNLTNEVYRRHTSFIKDLAPEMGRRVRVSYGLRFF